MRSLLLMISAILTLFQINMRLKSLIQAGAASLALPLALIFLVVGYTSPFWMKGETENLSIQRNGDAHHMIMKIDINYGLTSSCMTFNYLIQNVNRLILHQSSSTNCVNDVTLLAHRIMELETNGEREFII